MERRRRKSRRKIKFKPSRKLQKRLKTLGSLFLVLGIIVLLAKIFPKFFEQLPSPSKISISKKPKIVFVIDDIGHTREHQPLLEALKDNVTYAILPMLRHSRYFNDLSRRTRAEVILHLPLESVSGIIPGPGLITNQMSDDHILDLLKRDLLSVRNAVGVNNHMGSKGTSNVRLMNLILGDLKKRGLIFLDSETTNQSAAGKIGRQRGVKVLGRDVFLDNLDSKPAIRDRVSEAAAIAHRQGYAIAIGHDRPNTLEILSEEIPRLKRAGFQIVSLKDLI